MSILEDLIVCLSILELDLIENNIIWTGDLFCVIELVLFQNKRPSGMIVNTMHLSNLLKLWTH